MVVDQHTDLPPQPAPTWTPIEVYNAISNDGITIRTIQYNMDIIPDHDLQIASLETITQHTTQ